MSVERPRHHQQHQKEKRGKRRQRAAKHIDKVAEYHPHTQLTDEERELRREEAKRKREIRKEATRKEKELEKEEERRKEAFKMSGRERQIRGEKSEQRVFNYLDDQTTFPWIFVVITAKDSQPGYDFTIKIDKKHPLSKYLKVDVIYIDAKSSLNGVDDYFREQAKQCRGERAEIFCKLNRFALSAGPEQELEELDLQMVLQLLLLCGALFDEEKTTIILELLDERLVDAYRSEEELINKYVYAYIRTNLLPETVLE